MAKSNTDGLLKNFVQGDVVIQDLQTAISSLNKFARLNVAEPIPHFFHLDMKEGEHVSNSVASFQKIVSLARCFVTALLSNKVRRRREELRNRLQDDLIKAISIIKNSYPLLDKLKQGDPAQRSLAKAAIDTIDQFNEVLQSAQTKTPSWGQRLFRFLYRCSGFSCDERFVSQTINLPLLASAECHSPQHLGATQYRVTANPQKGASSVISRRISSLQGPQVCILPTLREVDAFRMKAITMIRNYGFASTSLGEALKAVRHTPVQSTASEETEGLKGYDATVVTFRQTLEPFPGEVLVLEGSFRRDAGSKVASIPIPDSFRLSSRSSQSGFPHPIQNNGWGLSDKLMPLCPDFPEKMPLCRALMEHKRKVAQGLLPLGNLLSRAKQLLDLKKELYEAHHDEFIDLHHRLAYAMISGDGTRQKHAVVKAAFKVVHHEPGAVERLAQGYASLADIYISRPLEVLQSAWLQTKSTGTWSRISPKDRFTLARSLFLDASKETEQQLKNERFAQMPPPLADYFVMLGTIIREPSCEIALQQMSEKIGFEPPVLSKFAMRLQANTFKQLMTFLVDLEQDLAENIDERRSYVKERLVTTLTNDVESFEENDLLEASRNTTALVNELNSYYCARAIG